ncbi:hypothetical protein MRX96_008252 [Rhipicephalus microplus]
MASLPWFARGPPLAVGDQTGRARAGQLATRDDAADARTQQQRPPPGESTCIQRRPSKAYTRTRRLEEPAARGETRKSRSTRLVILTSPASTSGNGTLLLRFGGSLRRSPRPPSGRCCSSSRRR